MSNVQLIFQWYRKQEQPNPPQAPTSIEEKLHLGDWQIYCALMLKCHLLVCTMQHSKLSRSLDRYNIQKYTRLYVPMSKYNLREYNFTVYDNIPLYWVSRLVVLMVCCYSQILHWIERSPLAFCSLNPGAKFFEKCDKSFQITKKILLLNT